MCLNPPMLKWKSQSPFKTFLRLHQSFETHLVKDTHYFHVAKSIGHFTELPILSLSSIPRT